MPAGEIGDHEVGEFRLLEQEPQRGEHAVAGHEVGFLAEKPQGHHRGVGFGERHVAALTVEKQPIDELERLRALQGDVAGDQRVEAAAGLGLFGRQAVAREQPADPLGIGHGTAHAEHRGIEPAAVGLHLRIFDPGQQLRGVHLVLQSADVGVRSDGELVVGIPGERVVFVLQVVLKEGEAVGALLRQVAEPPDVGHRPVAHADGARPDEVGRLHAHQEEQRADRFLLEHDGLDRLRIGPAQARLGNEVGPLEHLHDLELALGEWPVGLRRE